MFFQEQDIPLPTLRPDIEIYAGPLEEDGSPSFVIYDPLAGSYNKIGWGEAAVLQRLQHGQTLTALVSELNEQTSLKTTPEEVTALCQDAENSGLTVSSQVQSVPKLLKKANEKQTTPLKWLIRHYLYFRIPLFRSDAFLTRALPWVKFLASRAAISIYLFFACIGIYFLSQQFESYVSTFTHFLSTKGLIAYFLVIIVLKAAHEFGHAFSAKHYGVRVPAMGLAFMVFAPVAYSDVTDAWRLRNRKHRLAISLAGIKVEVVIGAFAMAFWGLSPPGLFNSTCFLLSSTSLLSTLLVNLNPAMRFDGYYILSDIWGIDNLSSQTTLFTKWVLRRNLLGLDLPCPIMKPGRRKQIQMFFYAIYAWNYRFFLYLGIAVLVYYKFTKSLGIILFIIEIMVFIVRPIIQEIKVLITMKKQFKFNFKLLLTAMVILMIALWAICPLPRNREAPAVLQPAINQTIYSPRDGRLNSISVKRGQMLNKGDVLASMESESLNTEIEFLSVRIQQLRHSIKKLSIDNEGTAMIPEMEKQLAAAEEERIGMVELRDQFSIKARVSGMLTEWDDMLSPGTYVKGQQALGQISSKKTVHIYAFISEKEVNHLIIGQDVEFYPSDHSDSISGSIDRVDPIREKSVDYLKIGSVAAEELPLLPDPVSGKLTLIESYYRVNIKVTNMYPENIRLGISGVIRYQTKNRSLAWELLLYCYSIFIRESSF